MKNKDFLYYKVMMNEKFDSLANVLYSNSYNLFDFRKRVRHRGRPSKEVSEMHRNIRSYKNNSPYVKRIDILYGCVTYRRYFETRGYL
jgi:hypothetical protein